MARWGMLGTGRIARRFAQALRSSASERVIAVASRDQARAGAFARELAIGRAYDSYDALLDDPHIEVVYIALPASMHAEWTIAAARAGKHVLCEKPLAISAAEAEEMFEAARQAGVWLMEAMMYRFHPQTLKVQELVAQGAIGSVRQVQASFTVKVSDPANTRLIPELGGGALFDVGCYCVNLVRMAIGVAPERVSAMALWAPSGVDESLLATIEHPGGALAQIACSLSATRNNLGRIIGSQGIIEVDEIFTPPSDRPAQIRIVRGVGSGDEELIEVAPADHFRLEAEGFVRLIGVGHGGHGLPEMPLVESLENAATIAALSQSAREGRAVQIGATESRVCSACGAAVKAIVMIEDHGPTVGEKPAEVAPGHARMSMGVAYNERYPLESTACMRCGHVDLWVDAGWVASLK
jgi:D-xylose 1-dehydrogenase (NADP+, D-xylono-1,5-lactone-forming)